MTPESPLEVYRKLNAEQNYKDSIFYNLTTLCGFEKIKPMQQCLKPALYMMASRERLHWLQKKKNSDCTEVYGKISLLLT